jgi:hypothetical protein
MTRQEGGDHYLNMGIQPWDAMRAWLSPEQFTGFLIGNAIKYCARFNAKAPDKGGLPDLLKARHYLETLIELETRE